MSTMRRRYHATILAAVGLAGCGEAPPVSQESAAEAAPPVMSVSQEQLLLAATKIALPPDDFEAVDLPDPSSTEAQLLVKYCGQCHGIPAPSMHSAGDWPSVARRMWLRMERLPDSLTMLVPEVGERVALLNYVMDNALQVSGASLPPGQGRHEYAQICSRCHALPDPSVHSPQDWPAVFMRMERNMERMNVTPATPQEATRILLYLGSCCPPNS